MKKLFLLLTMLSFVSLVGCTKTNLEEADNIISINRGESVTIDIDGDKEDDLITFGYLDIEDEFIGNYAVNVNGDEYVLEVCGPRDCMHLVKADKNKNEYILVFGEDGPSCDYASFLLRYKGHSFIELGSVEGVIDNDFDFSDPLVFNFDGTLTAPVRASIVQTWFYNANYEIKDDKLVKEEKDFYDVDYDTELLVDFDFYKEPKEDSEKTLVRSETVMKFIGTDDEKWTKVSYIDLYGDEAVAYFPVYYFGYMDEEMEVMDTDVFKDLCMAD